MDCYLDSGTHYCHITASDAWEPDPHIAYAILDGPGANKVAYITGLGYVTLRRLAQHLEIDLD